MNPAHINPKLQNNIGMQRLDAIQNVLTKIQDLETKISPLYASLSQVQTALNELSDKYDILQAKQATITDTVDGKLSDTINEMYTNIENFLTTQTPRPVAVDHTETLNDLLNRLQVLEQQVKEDTQTIQTTSSKKLLRPTALTKQ